jgi:hypothetical protein
MNEVNKPEALGRCPLCGRVMLSGDSVDRHHWQPKSRGGSEAGYLHRICHRKLHSLFTAKELAEDFVSPDQVRRHPEMQKFIKWVRRQPPERVVRHFKIRPK